MKFIQALFFCVFFTLGANAQNYEFIGVLKFDVKTMISYRLVINENKGKITGYSITDLQGENETKNNIVGTYDAKTGVITFHETDIVYTKSAAVKGDFCYVHFKGNVKLNDKATLKGKFEGLFKDNSKCVSGDMHLVVSAEANKRLNKVNNKLQKSDKVTEEQKQKLDLNGVVDDLKINMLKKDEITTAFVDCEEVKLTIWDAGKEDGDKITIFSNDKILLRDYVITKEKKTITLKLTNDECIIKVLALNMGEIAPNTCMFSVDCPNRKIELISNLEKDNATTLRIIKREQ